MAKPHLYLHTPEAVFKARVNMASVTYPVSQIAFDNVTLGTSGVLEFGMTMLLGTSEGADDLGRQRIRDVVVGSNIQIPFTSQGVEDGQLDVQDNAYITVLLDFRLWAKIPTFDVENAQDKKDGWISVGNKLTTEIPPVANAGPGFADYIDPTTGVITVEFPDGGINTSFTVGDGDTIVGHTWDVRDGTITVGSSSDETITATFPAGFRYVVHTVESSNGSTHTTRVPILAVDPDDDPTLRVYQASQRLEQTGQTLDITIYEDAPRATYPDGTLVMFWMDAPADPGDRSHMKFIGFVDNEDATVNRNQKGLVRETKLHCVDVAGRLRQLPGFPQALSRVEDESPWSYYPSLDMAKSLHYLLHWHCTALEIADFTIPSELLDYDAMRLDAGGASLFEQVNQQAGKAVPDYILTCNSLGQLVVTKDWRLVDVADRPAASPIITEDNWTDLSYSYNRHPKVHVLRSAAIEASTSFVDVDGVETLPLVFSIAPSNASAFGQGLSEHTENEGLALSQEDLNEAEGHRFAMLNARYGEFSFTDPTGEDFWEYEPALMQRVQLNIGAAYAAQRGLDFTTANGMIKSITVNYNTSNRGTSLKAQVTWEKEVSGFPAITYTPEDTEPVEYVPPEPSIPLPGDETVYYDNIQAYLLWSSERVFRTMDLQESSPTWELVDTGITGKIWDCQYFHPDENTVGAWLLGDDGVFLCMDLLDASPTWSHVLTDADLPAADGEIVSGWRVGAMAHYWLQPGHLCVAIRPVDPSDAVAYTYADFYVTEDYGDTWTHVHEQLYVLDTEEEPPNTYGYCLIKHNGMAAFRSEPIIWAARYSPTEGFNGYAAILESTDGGFTWNTKIPLRDPINENSAPAISHPYPDITSAAYVMYGVGVTSPDLHLEVSENGLGLFEYVDGISGDGIPTGYTGGYGYGNVPQRTNKRTFDNDHVMALWLKPSSSAGTLAESFDKGATWTELGDFSNSINIPNGWPPNVNEWVIVDGGTLDANSIRLTLDNFDTLSSRTGNLAAVLSAAGKSWGSGGYSGGFALPRLGINA